jgi:hypothetical protein
MSRILLLTLFANLFFFPHPVAGAESQWHPSLVDRMAGRFGAFGESYRYRKLGYLSLITDGPDVYSVTMGDNLLLGRPVLPSSYSYEEKFSWTGAERSYSFTSPDDEKGLLRIYESLLAPGFLYWTSEPVFRWSWEEQKTGQHFILPLSSGVEHRGEGERYIAARDGELAEPWLLVSFAGSQYPFDCPVLFLFEHKPAEIEVVTHEFLDIRFPGPAGKIILMPLYGVRKIENEKTAAWTEEIPGEVVRTCSIWRRRLEHYPVACREQYHFDSSGALEVRNSYEFVSFENAGGEPLAPIPPFVRMAQKGGYPVSIKGRLVETGYPTHYGVLDYVEGSELTYRIPACGYVDKTLAPVRVKGVQGISRIEEALEAYIRNPLWTWPGDHDYDPDDVMDTMHNLRLLAWATWSLPEGKRKRALKELAEPGIDRVRDELYFYFEDPVALASYARDSTVFAQRGKTSYDSDWYNGFQLAGLWAYRYFGHRAKGLRLARERWELWTALRNYMEIYNDWAICCSTTDPRGNLTDYDCMRNGWSGLLAYARLARDLGYLDQYRQTKYLASKTMVAFYVQWTLQKYFHDLASSFPPDRGKGFLKYDFEELTGVDRLETYVLHDITRPDDSSPYNLSACIPEHNLFLTDFGLNERVAKLTYDNLERYLPDWVDFDPFTYTSPGGWWSANAVGGRYFYFLDPHLFARAINFNEPLTKLLSYRRLDWLSGQAIEAILVGSRPMLVVPTDVEFFGNEWDEKRRSLTFTLEGFGTARVEIRNCPMPKKVTPEAGVSYDAKKRVAVLQMNLDGKIITKVYF